MRTPADRLHHPDAAQVHIDAPPLKRIADLIAELLPVDDEQNAVALKSSAAGKLGHDNGLASSAPQDDARGAIAVPVSLFYIIDNIDLVRPQLVHATYTSQPVASCTCRLNPSASPLLVERCSSQISRTRDRSFAFSSSMQFSILI